VSAEIELGRLVAGRFTDAGEPGCCAALIRGGAIAETVCVGMADPRSGAAVTPETNIRLASMTKQFTAMAVLMLREDGALSLGASLADLFPGFPGYGRGITLRHLLWHTSGIRAYEGLLSEGETRQVRDADVLALMAAQESGDFPPGGQFFYSNTGYALLAMAVEQITGTPFQGFLARRIFEPLGMTGTLAFVEDGPPVPRRAYGFRKRAGSWEFADQSPTSAVLGDGGVYCSVADYARWDAALSGGALVPPAAITEAFTRGATSDGAPVDYGFGWRLEREHGCEVVYHTGSTTGFNSCVRRMPSRGVTVIALANRTGTETHKITRDAARLLLAPKSAPPRD
jgi:CubicO group peptidase (beta-lactamase class C family)